MSFTKDEVVYLGSQTREELLDTACCYLERIMEYKATLERERSQNEAKKQKCIISNEAAQEIAKDFVINPSEEKFINIIHTHCLFPDEEIQNTDVFQILDAVLREIMIKNKD